MSEAPSLVLLSAGLDSAVNFLIALERGGVEVAVTVDYGQRAAARESEKAGALCRLYGVRHMVLEASWLGALSGDALTTSQTRMPEVEPDTLEDAARAKESMRAVWVPNRNGLLANMGACVAEALGLKWVIMGLNAEEGSTFPDNTAGFVREVNRALGYSTLSRVRLRSFTLSWDKMEILREAIARELDFRNVWSCYNGEELMCGCCESCARLLAAAETLRCSSRMEGLFQRGP
ncbi:MAG: 7-cyano-7-deazaguanine synthase [Actinobacteria bacterium]|nr:7-cyano-7-deazaguanine synthase [Actinomycetota bacterium]